ncbi:unnamed protein product [Parnassius apollo]|uniref:(apollo) hypothetical protein n=1 Tax=Parnassius apollo TaxID=110799 RepID=A0A8S3X863_PARAO|nr:unnamed protein product [Parnassius apollo]
MNICESCSNEFNDGAQCYVCKKHYGFGCAGITERGFRNLGADRRAQWKCLQCIKVSLSPSRPSSETNPGGNSGGESATLDVAGVVGWSQQFQVLSKTSNLLKLN